MKKFFKILSYTIGGLVVLIIGFLIYFNSTNPKVDPPSNEKVEITAARLIRGKYLAQHVANCIDCHSERDWTKYSAPAIPATYGKGGELFNMTTANVPGSVYARNITPAAIGDWTDGELIRAITCGVSKDGHALFPIMPYQGYNKLTQEDLYSLVAYVRSMKPVQNQVPDRSLDFPMNLIVKTIPIKTYTPAPAPDKNKPVEMGKYLVTVAGCVDCHTQMVRGEFVADKMFAGGFEFGIPSGTARSANITPDNETGIGAWSKSDFIERFKSMDPDSNKVMEVSGTEANTVMPWTLFGGMTREDLGYIYDYLRTLKPVKNTVEKFTEKK